MSLADEILATPDLNEREPIDVAAWPATKGKLFVRNMSAAEHQRYSTELFKHHGDKPNKLYATVAVSVLVDENGKRIFRDDQIEALNEKSAHAVAEVYAKWSNLSANAPSADDQKKD